MQAVVRTRYGSPDVLELRDIEVPTPKDNQVLIRVHAASVNPVDFHIMRGQPFFMRLMGFGLLKPKHRIIGLDLAGVVAAVGSGVSRFNVGDEVFGSGMGAFAEYACLNEMKLARKPKNVSFEQAAAVPIAAVTALQGLRDHGKVKSGDEVLVTGASGGVGSFAVQIAKAFGARVTGTCRTANVDLVQSLGADEVIDYTKQKFWERNQHYDVVIDNAPFYSLGKALRALKPGGDYIVVGWSPRNFLLQPLYTIPPWKKDGKKIGGLMAKITPEDLLALSDYLESGKIVPALGERFRLTEVAAAMRQMETGHTRGKLIIKITA